MRGNYIRNKQQHSKPAPTEVVLVRRRAVLGAGACAVSAPAFGEFNLNYLQCDSRRRRLPRSPFLRVHEQSCAIIRLCRLMRSSRIVFDIPSSSRVAMCPQHATLCNEHRRAAAAPRHRCANVHSLHGEVRGSFLTRFSLRARAKFTPLFGGPTTPGECDVSACECACSSVSSSP